MSDKLQKDLHKGLVEFLDEMSELFPDEMNIVLAKVFVRDMVSPSTLMNKFIEYALQHKNHIHQHNEDFFLSENNFFDSLCPSQIGYFRTLWQSPLLEPEDYEIIWSWFERFVHIAEKYQSML